MTLSKPTRILYHGTSFKYAGKIEQEGLLPQVHKHVYLTSDIQVAYAYAKKYDQQVICVVDAQQMYDDGFKFYIDNTEWLVSYVPSKYIVQILVEDELDVLNIEHYVNEVIQSI